MATINNVGVLSELIGVGLPIVLLFRHSVRSAGMAVFDALGRGGAAGYAGPFLAAAALTASYVMYGFDTAGSLAEETHDPRRRAPRAILQALSAAGAAGLLVLLFALMSASNLKAGALSSLEGGLPYIVKGVLGESLGPLVLCDVVFAIFCLHSECPYRLCKGALCHGSRPQVAVQCRVCPGVPNHTHAGYSGCPM